MCWGLTASDDPLVGYLAHEATPNRDNGTIAPTAALSSMPYAPAESIAAMKHFYRAHGDRLWGPLGFYDAFNLNEDWFATSYLAIDQGPVICMIENHRTELLWDYFMRNPEITEALEAIGFEYDSMFVSVNDQDLPDEGIVAFPVPASEMLYIHNITAEYISVDLLDITGVITIEENHLVTGGTLSLNTSLLPPGVYVIRAYGHSVHFTQKISVIR